MNMIASRINAPSPTARSLRFERWASSVKTRSRPALRAATQAWTSPSLRCGAVAFNSASHAFTSAESDACPMSETRRSTSVIVSSRRCGSFRESVEDVLEERVVLFVGHRANFLRRLLVCLDALRVGVFAELCFLHLLGVALSGLLQPTRLGWRSPSIVMHQLPVSAAVRRADASVRVRGDDDRQRLILDGVGLVGAQGFALELGCPFLERRLRRDVVPVKLVVAAPVLLVAVLSDLAALEGLVRGMFDRLDACGLKEALHRGGVRRVARRTVVVEHLIGQKLDVLALDLDRERAGTEERRRSFAVHAD